jgi:hypothetical protein
VAFVRCSKRRGGTPTGERAAISARRAEARIVDYASVGVPPSFFLFPFLALRAWIGMKGRTPPPASLNDRSKADASCRFRAACPMPRMPAASRERWCLALPPALAHVVTDVRAAQTDSPLSSWKASVVQDKEDLTGPAP